MIKLKSFLFGALTLFLSSAFSQDESRYFVYFKDKGAESNPYSLASPAAFLTERALDRRNKQNIDLDSTDLPVNPAYVSALENAGSDVFFTSKWLNGALLQASASKESAIRQLDFVDSLRLVAAGTRLVDEQEVVEVPTAFDAPEEILGDSEIQLMMLGADRMLLDSVMGQGVRVAVLDNGFTGVNRYLQFQHLWEDNHIIGTKDFVENSGNVFQFGSHGTSVFSTIGALMETDTIDYYGIAHRAEFILCVTEDNQGENTIEEYNWLIAAEYADSLGVDIINASLGYRTFDIQEQNYGFDDLDGKTAIVSYAAQVAARKGIIVVTSAGNSGRRSHPGNQMSHPADADSILAVGSVNADFSRSDFSSVGPTSDGRIKPDISAFGFGTAVVRGNGDIERGSGTSFAAPLIAGFAAGVWQLNPDMTSQEVIQEIKRSGHKADAPDTLLGFGVPNYSYILGIEEERGISIKDIIEGKVTFYPNPFTGNKLFFSTEGSFNVPIQIRIVDPKGSFIYNETFQPEDLGTTVEIPIEAIHQGIYYLFLQSENMQKVVKLINF